MLNDMEFLAKMLSYNRETGSFTWLVTRPGGRAYAGQQAGSVGCRGYVSISRGKRKVLAHRLAWFVEFGSVPSDRFVEHINGDRTDNRISNLRLATAAENMQNLSTPITNTSGYLGVTWSKKSKAWQAQISTDGKRKHLGLFNCPKQAHEAYLAEKLNTHGFQPAPRGAV